MAMDIDWITTVLSINDNPCIEFWKTLDQSLDFNQTDVAAFAIINSTEYKQMMCDEPDYLFDSKAIAQKYYGHLNYMNSFVGMIDQLAIFALLPMDIAIERAIKKIEVTHPDPVSINIGIMYIKIIRAYMKKEQINVDELVRHWKDTSQSRDRFIDQIRTLNPLNIRSHSHESSIYLDIYSCYLMLKYKDSRYTNSPDYGYRTIFQKNKRPNPIIKEIILRVFR